jgi:Holliday junction resolvase
VPGPRGCWTPELEAQLRERYADYARAGRVQELADELSALAGETIPRQRVVNKAARLGLTKKEHARRAIYADWSPERCREDFEAFKASGLCVLRYCAKHGYNPGAWSRAIRAQVPEEEWDAATEHNWPAHHWYVKGRSLEYRVKAQLERMGFFAVRTKRSLTAADVSAMRDGLNLLVQCKLHGYVPPDEWNRLVDLAAQAGAVPLIASSKTGRLQYFRVDAKKPRKGSGSRLPEPKTPVQVTREGIVEVASRPAVTAAHAVPAAVAPTTARGSPQSW